MDPNKIDTKFVLEHAQPIRLIAAGACQVLAFLLLLSSSGIVYGNREMFIVILMLAATVLAGFALFRYEYSVKRSVVSDLHDDKAS